MDVSTLKMEVIPKLEELFFPKLLLGEQVYYMQEAGGAWIRANKDKAPEDSDYIPNDIINISPAEQLKKIKNYLDLSFFTHNQYDLIFSTLDKKLEVFSNIPLSRLISYDRIKVDFKAVEKDLAAKKDELIQNYQMLRDDILSSPTQTKDNLVIPHFKTSYTVEELAYFFKLSIEQGIIVLDKNQKTKFFDFIAANFQSKDQKQISPNSIRNKSYDPSLATIEKIREDILQMLQFTKVHRDSDKIEWKK